MLLLPILALSFLLPLASGFYLPGVAPLDLAQVGHGNVVRLRSVCSLFCAFSEIRQCCWSSLGLFSDVA